jgi:adenylyltransferase/sulfurtransferase
MFGFSPEELERYSRNILLPEVGGKGQKKLRDAKVLMIGAGGLGSPVALYLAAAGVGKIGLIDGDTVDLSNLQRQLLHSTKDLGRPKVESAREKLVALNPHIQVEVFNQRLVAENVLDILSGYHLAVDGVDNFATRFLANDACVIQQKPYFHGGVLRFFGQAMTVIPGQGPCYRCVFRQPPPAGSAPTCAEAGVLGAVVGVIASIQATEVIKYILGVGDLLQGRLMTFDGLTMNFETVQIKQDENCPVCGHKPTILQPRDEEENDCRDK